MSYELMVLQELADGFSNIIHEIALGIAGAMSLDHWAHTASRAAADIVERVTSNEHITYVGGYVTFRRSPRNKSMVEAVLDLYFQDPSRRWRKTSSVAEIRRTSFTRAALSSIESGEGAAFELD